jgi:hypothetical protein
VAIFIILEVLCGVLVCCYKQYGYPADLHSCGVEFVSSLRVTYFLWLLANNKVLTRNNLAKRKNVADKTCLFCVENESVTHLFYGCCVAKRMWFEVAEITN